jgi:hypothetical protein
VAGIAATAAGDWDAAGAHVQRALRRADELPHQLERLETRRCYAHMLLERGAERGVVARLLGEAVHGYRRLGMPRHVELTNDLMQRVTR